MLFIFFTENIVQNKLKKKQKKKIDSDSSPQKRNIKNTREKNVDKEEDIIPEHLKEKLSKHDYSRGMYFFI